MRITVEFRRPSRRAIVVLVAALALMPGVALANHNFPDVTNANPFHTAIGAIYKAGIASGFGDGTYRPADPVTRQAMAAFMHRGLGRVGMASGGTPTSPSVSVVAGTFMSATAPIVRQLTITVPGATNASSPNQLVHLQGRVTFQNAMGTAGAGCPCQFTAWIKDQAAFSPSHFQAQTFGTSSELIFLWTMEVETVLEATPGAHTYELLVQLTHRASATNAATFTFDEFSSLSATTFPFGPTGTSDI